VIGFSLTLEGLLGAWYIKELFFDTSTDMYLKILFLLLYFSLKFYYYLRFDDLKKNNTMGLWLLPLFAAIMILMIQSFVFVPIVLFFGICIYQAEFQSLRMRGGLALAVCVLAGFFVDISFLQNYIIASAFALLSMIAVSEYQRLVNRLKAQQESLTEKIEEMYESAAAAKAYDISVRYASQLEERNRIAQKLHDELGHTLSGSTMQLEAIMLLAEKNPEKAQVMLSTVIKGLRAGTESIRRILKDIKPEAASLSIGAIKQMAAGIMEKSGIQTDVVYDADITMMTREQWRVAHENIREALTNMMKHSGASRVIISFERLNKLIKITVKDNGCGCPHISSGLGLSGMEERTQQLGGTLILDGAQGFSVITLLPISREREQANGN